MVGILASKASSNTIFFIFQGDTHFFVPENAQKSLAFSLHNTKTHRCNEVMTSRVLVKNHNDNNASTLKFPTTAASGFLRHT